ncbi:hypothetical protein GWI33_006334 [Rhynchophorus ferrugineus]|uniref:Uncharacterized protein n=1 Tax=Rhynchophorus ferrugineus TaxID=354439 RepID=A0A834IKJ1_RHYFE|nr:hypothetical protein GWI33_006334 [Rhynchophorus ferrugineus]
MTRCDLVRSFVEEDWRQTCRILYSSASIQGRIKRRIRKNATPQSRGSSAPFYRLKRNLVNDLLLRGGICPDTDPRCAFELVPPSAGCLGPPRLHKTPMFVYMGTYSHKLSKQTNRLTFVSYLHVILPAIFIESFRDL